VQRVNAPNNRVERGLKADKSLAEIECKAPSHVFVETVRVYQDEYTENAVNTK
jgi:type IV secretory pathway ATPase VirB11/archaellum biosynthesis ATPase